MNVMTKNKGFTLIELMIVVVIIGILSSIALPSYQQYTMRANRTDGMSAIQMLLDAQERYYADHISYTADLTKLGLSDPYITPEGKYSIKAAVCSSAIPLSRCVELTATARGGQVKDGDLVANTQGKKERKVGGVTHSW